LKKQSQFAAGQIGVKSYIEGGYEKIHVLKTATKQSQFKVCPEQSRMGQFIAAEPTKRAEFITADNSLTGRTKYGDL
jgi:hypothetical protein